MSPAHPLNLWFRAVRRVGVRAGLPAGAGSPSLLYNHVNRSFLQRRGLFDQGVLVARPFSCAAGPGTTWVSHLRRELGGLRVPLAKHLDRVRLCRTRVVHLVREIIDDLPDGRQTPLEHSEIGIFSDSRAPLPEQDARLRVVSQTALKVKLAARLPRLHDLLAVVGRTLQSPAQRDSPIPAPLLVRVKQRRLHFWEEVRNLDAHRPCQLFEGFDRRISPPLLDLVDGRPVHPGGLGQTDLGKPRLCAHPPQLFQTTLLGRVAHSIQALWRTRHTYMSDVCPNRLP